MQGPGCEYDVIIVGSGPAGVSAAFPLVESGLRVLMVDGGKTPRQPAPRMNFLTARATDPNQWRWMLGEQCEALRQLHGVSPKVRAPTNTFVFEEALEKNRIEACDLVAISSLAVGGLSRAWGGGVAFLTDEELARYPVPPGEMRSSCEAVAKRIGISGPRGDDLADFFAVDAWTQPALPLDAVAAFLLARYRQKRERLTRRGFRLGQSRVAVLSQGLKGREACDLSGNCLWGCEKRALYAASDDLEELKNRPNFRHLPGFIVERVISEAGVVKVIGGSQEGPKVLSGRKVLLACGTLATTRLALLAINFREELAMQSCPTAAFLLWIPRFLGHRPANFFGLGQLSFELKLSGATSCFGSLFKTTGVPVFEFAKELPFGTRFGVDLLEPLLRSSLVGNLFLPGSFSDIRVQLGEDGVLVVRGGYRDQASVLFGEARRRLRWAFARLGAQLLLPSFRVGKPGSDIHYAGTLPMARNPERGQTDPLGELPGAPGIHIIDGACLPVLPAKSHTLVIMANAHRIGQALAQKLAAKQA